MIKFVSGCVASWHWQELCNVRPSVSQCQCHWQYSQLSEKSWNNWHLHERGGWVGGSANLKSYTNTSKKLGKKKTVKTGVAGLGLGLGGRMWMQSVPLLIMIIRRRVKSDVWRKKKEEKTFVWNHIDTVQCGTWGLSMGTLKIFQA